MCGIAGIIWNREVDSSEIERPLRAMQAALRHRGPDDSGLFISQPSTLNSQPVPSAPSSQLRAPRSSLPARCSFAHTRLSILDLSDAGHQPMSTPDGRFTIVFNGEIYNFQSLRSELLSRGCVFRSNSDTEVILQLFAREGRECIKRLRGMFAFAIWDNVERRCFLARDPLGIKPLYYSQKDGALLFASELRALLASGLVRRRLCGAALARYFRTGTVPEPFTLVEDVRCLPAGHCATWSSTSWRIDPYWAWPFETGDGVPSQPAALRAALIDSVANHFVSDVPVGVFLSGGIDSTAIVALACGMRREAVNTFSISVDHGQLDEGAVARRTAEHFRTRHHELRLDGTLAQQSFGEYLRALDQPTIDGFNTFCVSKLTRAAGIKVVLSGLGGDELFGSYPSFRAVPKLLRLARAASLCPPLRRKLGAAMQQNAGTARTRRLGDFFEGRPSITAAYTNYRAVFTRNESARVASAFLGEPLGDVFVETTDPAAEHLDDKEAVSYLECTRYMRNQLLRDSDVMSMAFGLELRVPFVDSTLVSHVLRWPSENRFAPGKKLLLDAVPEIPEWIRNQPKRGFLFPFQQWLDGDWRESFDKAAALSPVPAQTWYQKWSLFVLHDWCERNDVPLVPSPPRTGRGLG